MRPGPRGSQDARRAGPGPDHAGVSRRGWDGRSRRRLPRPLPPLRRVERSRREGRSPRRDGLGRMGDTPDRREIDPPKQVPKGIHRGAEDLDRAIRLRTAKGGITCR